MWIIQRNRSSAADKFHIRFNDTGWSCGRFLNTKIPIEQFWNVTVDFREPLVRLDLRSIG